MPLTTRLFAPARQAFPDARTAKALALNAEASTSANAKAHLQDKEGILTLTEQRLIFAEKQLGKGRTMSDHRSSPMVRLNVLGDHMAEMPTTAYTTTTMTRNAARGAYIFFTGPVTVAQWRAVRQIYGGQQLEDGRMLSHYNIGNGDIIDFVAERKRKGSDNIVTTITRTRGARSSASARARTRTRTTTITRATSARIRTRATACASLGSELEGGLWRSPPL